MHHIQANVAFIRDRKNVRFYEVVEWSRGRGHDEGWVRLRPASGGDEVVWNVEFGGRLEAVLDRRDLTRRSGNPLVVANPTKRVLGIAVGPERPPAQIAITGAFDLEDEVLLADDPRQPRWWLFDGSEYDPTEPRRRSGLERKHMRGAQEPQPARDEA